MYVCDVDVETFYFATRFKTAKERVRGRERRDVYDLEGLNDMT